jgi:uncharacterized protein
MNPEEKKTLVIGASLKPERYSNKAISKLVKCNVPVVAVGLREGEVSGVRIMKPFPEVSGIHTVTLYVGPRNQPFWFEFILGVKPKRVIFNPGTYNEDLVLKLRETGAEIVEDCTLVMLGNNTF